MKPTIDVGLTILYGLGWFAFFLLAQRVSPWIGKRLIWVFSKTVTPHTNKILPLFAFSVTLFISVTISFGLLEYIGFKSLWPYMMTFLTFLLGWETYTLYKKGNPTPLNHQIDKILVINSLKDEGETE